MEDDSLKTVPKSNVVSDTIMVESITSDIPSEKNLLNQNMFGFIDIKCKPWADVFIDSIKIDTTPFKEVYRLSYGEHILQLKHPEYPEYQSILNVLENDTLFISVNLDTLVGFFTCNVFPWGDIYINKDYKGQTPLNKPIILKPGIHLFEVKNPSYRNHQSEISISKSDTLKMTVKLENLVNSN